MVKYDRLLEILGPAKELDKFWTYGDLLKLPFWKERRNTILHRDKNICINCGLEGTIIERNSAVQGFGYLSYEVSHYIPQDSDYKLTVDDINSIRIFYKPTTPVILHVHHHYYLLDSLPWEYNDKVLITYCSKCHSDWHNKNRAIVYQKIDGKYYKKTVTPCIKCNGVGSLVQYDYYMDGVCFRCFGSRYEELIEYCRPPKNNDICK